MSFIAQELLSNELADEAISLRSHLGQDSSWSLLSLLTLARAIEHGDGEQVAPDLDGLIHRDVLRTLLTTLHHRDPSIVRHSRRVASLAVGLAQHLGWEGRHLTLLEVAALLHDIGKVGIPDNILAKPTQLSPDEAELLSAHYGVGLNVLQACRVDQDVLELIVRSQPQFCTGEEILPKVGEETNLGARLLSVVDAYASLTSPKAYRHACSHAEALAQLTASRSHDDNLVLALGNWLEREGLQPEEQDHALDQAFGGNGLTPEQTIEVSSLCQIFSQLYMIESVYDGLMLVDSDMRVLVWNRGIERLLGRSAKSMRHQMWSSALLEYRSSNGEPLTDAACPMHVALTTGKSVTTLVSVPRPDARNLSVEVQTVPLIDRTGRVRGVAEIFRDLTREPKRKNHQLRELKLAASRDALTSVANRGELESQLAELLANYQRKPSERFAVIFVDADHFKSINDTYGHAAGDQVLITLSRVLEHETYSGELVGRYGGEEFVVLCPGVDLATGVRRAERLRWAIRNLRIRGLDKLRLTASFGVAEVEKGDNVEQLLRRADKALYQAKESGRDRTCSMTSLEMDTTRSMPTINVEENEFVHSSTFTAVVAADMVVYKLGGFIHDNKATVKAVSAEQVTLHLGTTFWSFLGSSPKDLPVELTLSFANRVNTPKVRGLQTGGRTSVGMTIRPRGRLPKAEHFRERAERVARELRQYFVADAATSLS